MKKFVLILIGIAVAASAASFYGGMRYAARNGIRGQFSDMNMQNFSPEERQRRFQQFSGGNVASSGGLVRGGAGFVSGEIIGIDDASVTLNLADGGSRILFLSESTSVTKPVRASVADIS